MGCERVVDFGHLVTQPCSTLLVPPISFVHIAQRALCLSDDCPQSMFLPCFLGGLVLLRAVRLLLQRPTPGGFMTFVKLSGLSVSVAVFREGFYFS